MSKDRRVTNWFDTQLDDLKNEFDKLAGTSGASARTPSYTPPAPKVAPAAKAPATRSTPEARETRSPPAAAPKPAPRPATPAPTPTPQRRAPSGSGYMLGVDVGGTFTDLLLIEEASGAPFPQDVETQLWDALGAVFSSWSNARAVRSPWWTKRLRARPAHSATRAALRRFCVLRARNRASCGGCRECWRMRRIL